MIYSIYPELNCIFTWCSYQLWKRPLLEACLLRFAGLVHLWVFLVLHLYSPQRSHSCSVWHVVSLALTSPWLLCCLTAGPPDPLTLIPHLCNTTAYHSLTRSMLGSTQPSPYPLGHFNKCGTTCVPVAAKQHVAQVSPARLPCRETLIFGATLWYLASTTHETHQNTIIYEAFVKCGWTWLILQGEGGKQNKYTSPTSKEISLNPEHWFAKLLSLRCRTRERNAGNYRAALTSDTVMCAPRPRDEALRVQSLPLGSGLRLPLKLLDSGKAKRHKQKINPIVSLLCLQGCLPIIKSTSQACGTDYGRWVLLWDSTWVCSKTLVISVESLRTKLALIWS